MGLANSNLEHRLGVAMVIVAALKFETGPVNAKLEHHPTVTRATVAASNFIRNSLVNANLERYSN